MSGILRDAKNNGKFETYHFHSWFSFIVRVKSPSKIRRSIGEARYQYTMLFLNTVTCHIAIIPWQAKTKRVITALIVANTLPMFAILLISFDFHWFLLIFINLVVFDWFRRCIIVYVVIFIYQIFFQKYFFLKTCIFFTITIIILTSVSCWHSFILIALLTTFNCLIFESLN